ncbi:hypothetical protein HGRIS_013074 [Hohenbuehelia grisea]|uniref:FHF complex subunit HOOK-interacting protein C-terminal domain-containing protein n=1 Tax=Hohenbuehelia grisea TaxID=104357 RepID=A0ABR3IUF0_9AGAR
MDVAMSPGEQFHRLADTKSSLEPPVVDPITDAALALAEYILDGDFSDVLAAGLGAVYSTLPSKLEFRSLGETNSPQSTGMVIGGLGPEDEDEIEALEVAKDQRRAMGVEDASNPDFRARLDHFLKLLEFIQDVLKRNTRPENSPPDLDPSALVGSAIVQSILDAVRRVFLENILYPSILECSDVDGSAVAVMSYVEVMLCSLREGPLSERIVTFLTSEDNEEVRTRTKTLDLAEGTAKNAPPQAKSSIPADKRTKSQRRKSSAMMLLEMEAPDSHKQSEYFTSMERFTLKDLLLTNLRSQSQPTAASAVQLLRSLLLHHPQLCQERLLLVIPDPLATSYPYPAPLVPEKPHVSSFPTPDEDDEETFVYPGESDDEPFDIDSLVFPFAQTTYSTHEREMDLYLTLMSRVDPSHNTDAFSTGYEHYLHDALLGIQEQQFFRLDIDPELRQYLKHRLNVNDPVLSVILEALRRFFSNTPEFNIALTGLLATLAAHPDRSLAGWLTFAVDEVGLPAGETLEPDDDTFANDGDDRSIDCIIDEKLSTETNVLPASRMDQKSRPVVHSIIQGLVAQLDRYRQLVDDFDKYLLERRQGLLFSENLTDALTLALDINDEPVILRSQPEPPESPKPKRPSASSTASSIVSLFTPKKRKPAEQAQATPEPRTPSKDPRNKAVAASPFGAHYQRTGAISVEPFVAPVPSAGLWTPAKKNKWTSDEEDVFSAGWTEQPSASSPSQYDDDDEDEKPAAKGSEVTLSQLLDNVVILEESIKELVAIIHARRSLGIDSIRYL